MPIEIGDLLAKVRLDTSGFQSGVDTLKNAREDLGKQFDAMRADLDKLGPAIQTPVKEMGGVMQALQDNAGKIALVGTAMTAAAGTVGAGMVNMTRDAGKFAEQIGFVKDRTGLDIAAIEALFVGLNRVNLDFSSVEMGFRKLSKEFEKAKQNMEEGQQSFQLFGQVFSGSESPTQIFLAFADAIQETADPLERVKLASEVFGSRVGQRLIPLLKDGSEGFAALSAEAAKMGLAFDPDLLNKLQQTDDKFDDIQTAYKGLTTALGGAANGQVSQWADILIVAIQAATRTINGLPDSVRTAFEVLFVGGSVMGPALLGLAAFVKAWATIQPVVLAVGAALSTPAALFLGIAAAAFVAYQNFDQIHEVLQRVGKSFNSFIADGLNKMGDAIRGMVQSVLGWLTAMRDTAINLVRGMVDAIGDYLGMKLGAVFARMKEPIEQAKSWFKGMYDAVVGHSYVPDMVDEIGQHMRKLDTHLTAPARNAAISVENAFRGMQFTVDDVVTALFDRMAYASGSIIQTVSQSIASSIQHINTWKQAGQQMLNQLLVTFINFALSTATAWAVGEFSRVAATQTANGAIMASTAATTTGMGAMFTAFFAGAKALMLGLAHAVVSVTSLVVGAISTVLDGISYVLSFALQAIADMIFAAAAAVQSIPIVGQILGAVMLGAGVLVEGVAVALPGLISGVGALLTSGVSALAASIPAMAEGGIVTGPTLAMVGEAGPEAIIPLRGRNAGVGGVTKLFVMLDSRVLTQAVMQTMPGEFYLRTGRA